MDRWPEQMQVMDNVALMPDEPHHHQGHQDSLDDVILHCRTRFNVALADVELFTYCRYWRWWMQRQRHVKISPIKV